MNEEFETPMSLSPNNGNSCLTLDDYKYGGMAEMTHMCDTLPSPSQPTNDFIASISNDLHNKFEDVDLDCDNYITYEQFLDVIGEFYISSSSYIVDDGYVIIWNKMLIEQNYHYDYNNDMLYIPFILKYMKQFLIQSINKLNINRASIHNLNAFHDEILSLSLKLIYCSSTNDIANTVTCASFASRSESGYCHNPKSDHILIQKAIKSFIKLANNFPIITKEKQLMAPINVAEQIEDDLYGYAHADGCDVNDYLNVMNNLMAAPKALKMRVKKKKSVNRKRYNLVSIDNDNQPLSSQSVSGSDNDEFQFDESEFDEIDIDGIELNEIYNQHKNKIFDKYIVQNLSMKQLMNAYQVSVIEKQKRELILRAITVFDSATHKNAPIYMEISKINSYLKQRGLTDKDIKIAYECSAASFEKKTNLKLTNSPCNNDESNAENKTESNPDIIQMKRRNSLLVNNDLFYIKKNNKNNANAKEICVTKTFIICLTLVILFITFHFGIAQILTAKLYVDSDINVDDIDWNYLVMVENNKWYSYISFHSNDWTHLLFFILFMIFGAYQIYFMLNIVSNFRFGLVNFCYLLFCCCCKHNWYIEKNMFFGSTHWFIIMVLAQITLICIESLRLANFVMSKKAEYVFIFCINVGIACIINGLLYLFIIFHYINIKKGSIYRKKTFIIILIFDFMVNFIFILTPCIFTLSSSNEHNFHYPDQGFYLQIVSLFHFETFIDFVSTLFPIFLLLWHIFDIINLFEEKYCIVIMPKRELDDDVLDTVIQQQEQRRNTFVSQIRQIETKKQNETVTSKMSRRTGSISVTRISRKSISVTTEEIGGIATNPFYEPSPSLTNMQIMDLNLLHRKQSVESTQDQYTQSKQIKKQNKKMIRNKHKTTNRLLFCCCMIAIICILYGMFVIIGVGYLYNTYSYNLCANPSLNDIQQQPALVVWEEQCEYKLYFAQCNCKRFRWKVSGTDYIALKMEIEEEYNNSITTQDILASVINDFTKLEILYIEWYLHIHEQNITVDIIHFPYEMEALFISNVAFAEHTKFVMPKLEILNVKYMKWSMNAINSSLETSQYLSFFSIENVIIEDIPSVICSLSHLENVYISGAFISGIPLCVSAMNSFAFTIDLLFNLNGSLSKQILVNMEMDEIDLLPLYIEFNPVYNNELLLCLSKEKCKYVGLCEPFCNDVIILDGNDEICDSDCRSAMLWFQNIDTNSNGMIEEVEMFGESLSMLMSAFFASNFTEMILYPMNFMSFVDDIWLIDANCSEF